LLIIPVGLVFGVVYYVIFSWAIRHFDIPTIGRYDEEAAIDDDADMTEYTQQMIGKLGGLDNLEEVGSCITRLRLKVSDADKVDEAALKAMGVKGIIKKGQAVQVVVGTRAELIANEINASMKK
jgi:PTS system N-acetylglucosamine-specific IIC component